MSRYTIDVKPFGYPNVSRTLALAGRHSLEQLHTAIIEAFEFEDDHLHAFFINGHAWDREFGYFSRPDIGQKDTAGTKLDSLDLVQHKRFLYLFDYGDEHRFMLRVSEIEPASEGPSLPELIDASGVAPKPYQSEEAEAAERPEPDPAWRDLSEQIRLYLAPPENVEQLTTPERTSTEQLALATAILDRVGGDEAMLYQLAGWTDVALVDWLLELPRELERGDALAEAFALSQRIGAFSFGELLEPSMALWAARLNHRERALELIDSSLRKNPHDAAVMRDLGVALEQLGDGVRAEWCYREALRFAGTDLGFRKSVIEELLRLLENQGRAIERRQLEQSEARWRDRYLSTSTLTGLPQTIKNAAAKVGRNDPCPCGSTKKYKKCCGAAA